ncbi:Fe-S cluster assembly protein SufD [Lactobacillus corticis]|uniref:Fe-S cluster assembly protein SufD n=1 Tax=Lactobacillus corticis TaxID=2201249 RepID=A0A916QI69_9LACO|nr:Fe-S cluster assembly protein SufD [Lactobacillus corticis]GFZ26738.1 Fe-S cluster assembly protein SufD [Lactobacillus corticis]
MVNTEVDFWEKRRQAALAAYETGKLPYIQRFHYQDWTLFDETQPLASDSGLLDQALLKTDPQQIKIVQFGKSTILIQVPEKLLQAGLIVCDLKTALKEHPDLIEKYYMTQVIKPDENKLLSYHAAFCEAGLVIYVPAKMELAEPIEVELVGDATRKQPWLHHLLLIAGANSSLKFVQHLSTIGEQPQIANLVAEVVAGPNSHIEFSSLDEVGKNTTLYFNRRANLDADSHLEWNCAFMNDADSIGDVCSELVGQGSYGYSKAIAVTAGDEQMAVNNLVINRGRHTTGLINQRGVLLDNSKLIFNGIGQIVHGASGSKADQKNRVLMMSDNAHGDANPLLLIDENDVVAAHAASVGPVDPVQMNYLMSRGIPYPKAERMVIHGFLDAVLSGMPKGMVRDRMLTILERKLIHGQRQRFSEV